MGTDGMIAGKNYCITAENLPFHEFMGLQAKIVKAADRGMEGLAGKIIDESRQTFTLEGKRGEKSVPKKGVQMQIALGKENVLVDCSRLAVRPVERLKLNRGWLYG